MELIKYMIVKLIVVFTPDDKLIVTAGMDGTSQKKNYTEEKDMYNFKKHDHICYISIY